MTKEEENKAKEQAISQYESIADLVSRLNHIKECDGQDVKDGGDGCLLNTQQIYAGLNLSHSEGDKATEEQREEYHNEDKAREAIHEDPLSVQVRNAGWRNPGADSDSKPDEYEILLCTGGPAVRIVGNLSEHCEPETARIEFQDWYTPWQEWTGASESVLLEYAKEFYFGE